MKWMVPILLLVTVVAAALRLPELAERPMHHDEANQAYRFGLLLEQGTYSYDPQDHHGPTLYYLTLPFVWLTDADTFTETTEVTYRLVPVVFSLLLVFCTGMLRKGLGRTAVVSAALFAAVSPALVYYARFYIQETLLVFFTLLALAAGWNMIRTGSRRWAVICGTAAGLMFATKETAVIAYAAMGGAGLISFKTGRPSKQAVVNILLATACAAVVSVVLFSSFFTNMQGPLDAVLAFRGYLVRGAGFDTDHIHPWTFYLRMMTLYRIDGGPIWSEGLIFGLGLGGCLLILLKKLPPSIDAGLARFLMVYTVLMTAIYSFISYKTPWCILSMLHGWILLAGIAVATLLAQIRSRKGAALLLFLLSAGLIQMTSQACRAAFRHAADYRNPYVYAQTVPEFMQLVQRIEALAEINPQGRELYIQVIAPSSSTWPLPFYLRRFPHVGYWADETTVPDRPKPALVVASPDVALDPDAYVSEFHALRLDELLVLHIDAALWEQFMEQETAKLPDK